MFNDYFPPYKAAIDAGAATCMTSFNDINGIPSVWQSLAMLDRPASQTMAIQGVGRFGLHVDQ